MQTILPEDILVKKKKRQIILHSIVHRFDDTVVKGSLSGRLRYTCCIQTKEVR